MRRLLPDSLPVSGWLALSLVFLAAMPVLATLMASSLGVSNDALTLIAFASSVVGLAMVALVVRKFVVHPLYETAVVARKFAAGDIEALIPRTRVEEITDVLAAFDYMRAELRLSHERRAALEQERKMFISGVAHDLRTPLFALRGYIEGLEGGVAQTPERRERYLGAAKERARRLDRLINDLFDFARLEYVDLTPELKPLDLSKLLDKCLRGERRSIEANGQCLFVQGRDGPCTILGDEDLLVRVFDNLIDNARRHTPAGGSITVSWTSGESHVGFSVADTGPGIPSHELPHIFEPAFRGDASRRSQDAGAGLGLPIARRIVEAHGGCLTAENGESGGAVFKVSLPASTAGGERDIPS